MEETKTPSEWIEYLGLGRIIDADGWRDSALSMYDQHTKAEFYQRYNLCTVMHVPTVSERLRDLSIDLATLIRFKRDLHWGHSASVAQLSETIEITTACIAKLAGLVTDLNDRIKKLEEK